VERTGHRVDALIYSLFAGLVLAALAHLCYSEPVVYTRLVNEDQWGEYGTAVGFGLAGVALLGLSARPAPPARRFLWALFGLTALGIAGEEVSWGQRMFHYSTPPLFHELNTQGEVNLHNFGQFDALLNRSGLLRQTVSLLILGWSALSLLISISAPRLLKRLEDVGLPVIPPRLLPFFLAVPLLFIVKPLARSDEIGELFLAAAVLAWTADLWLRHSLTSPPRNGKCALIVLGVFLAGALFSIALTKKFPGSLKGALESMATRGYPEMAMYDQADQIYRHIYANPDLLRPETRIKHARMLLELGQEERAHQVLREDLVELSDGPRDKERHGEFLRRRGTVHALLGETDQAATDFAEAIKIERRAAESTSDPDEKAERLWLVAQTLEARGDLGEALSVAGEAREIAVSGKVRRKLEEWVLFLKDPAAARAQLKL